MRIPFASDLHLEFKENPLIFRVTLFDGQNFMSTSTTIVIVYQR